MNAYEAIDVRRRLAGKWLDRGHLHSSVHISGAYDMFIKECRSETVDRCL